MGDKAEDPVAERQSAAENEAGDREPVVLIHGFTSIAEMWDNVLEPLKQRYDVHVIKLVGHYGGEPFAEGVTPSVTALVDAVESAMDEAGLKSAHIAGNSLGGWIALELGARGRARSVVAMSPGGGWNRYRFSELRLIPLFTGLRLMSKAGLLLLDALARFPVVRRMALHPAVQHGERISGEVAQKMVVGMARCPTFFKLIASDLRLPLMSPRFFDAPVIFLWGTKDRILPMRHYADLWLKTFPQADWRILPDVGHITSLDAPDAAIAAIDDAVARTNSPGREALAAA